MNLFDYIDEEEAERLIAQHDRYDYQGCNIERRWTYTGRIRTGRWFVYSRGKEIACWRDPGAEPKGYHDLAEALEAAHGFSLAVEDGQIKLPTEEAKP